MKPKGTTKKRNILLDTNVWAYIREENAGDRIAMAARKNHVEIQISPAVVYEAFNWSDPNRKSEMLILLTRRAWKRLMPEVYSECEELINAFRVLRPLWLKGSPQLYKKRFLIDDWTKEKGGFWERARWDQMPQFAAEHEIKKVPALDEYRDLKMKMKGANWHYEKTFLNKITAYTEFKDGPWGNSEFEAWRFSIAGSLMHQLKQRGTYYEWLDAEVDVKEIINNENSWISFWRHDVSRRQVPRQWVRWAARTLQSFRKLSNGAPADTQLMTYLLQDAIFVSADKVFIECIERIRLEYSGVLAETILIKSGPAAISALIELIEAGQP